MCSRILFSVVLCFISVTPEDTKIKFLSDSYKSLADINFKLLEQQICHKNELHRLPRHCKDIQELPGKRTNIYRIQPKVCSNSFMVLCDMTVMDGGWTYIMNRFNGSQDFDLNWKNYKEGFGRVNGEFWLGLDKIHELTTSGEVNELLIELVDWNNRKEVAYYSSFAIGDESKSYELEMLDGFKGTVEEAFYRHLGKKFSTRDRDQDNDEDGNCAGYRIGGWWYDDCFFTKLTGKYLKGKLSNEEKFMGIHWRNFPVNVSSYSLKQARMMVRPRQGTAAMELPHERG